MLRSYIYKPDYIDNTIDLNSNAAKELDWMSFWEQLFVKSVNSSLDSFAHLNEELKKEQNSEKKTLPMNLEEDALTASEEKSMIQSGYLTRDGEKLYLPEIIRHALGFRYERGARPRVLSLLLNSILFSNYHRKAPYGAFQNQQIHFSAVLAISSSTSSAISLFSALTEI